jgi:hypothetical protein
LAGLAATTAVVAAAATGVLVSVHGGGSRPSAPAAARIAGTAAVPGGGGSDPSAPPPTASASPTASAAIPWVDAPGTPQSPPAPTSAARPCRAADLDIAAGQSGAFRGMATQELTLRDRAADACFIAAVPQAMLPNAGSRSRVSPGQFAATRLDLAAGESATVLIGTPPVCDGSGQPVVATSVLLTLPDGEAVTVNGTRIDTECGAPTVVEFDKADVPASTPAPLSWLSASLDAPQTVARGAVLTYQVTLTNPSPVSVTLSPCPSYTEVLGTGTAAAQRTLLVNCQAGASISANAAVTYQVKLTVPSSAPTGPTKLTWKLEVPDGPVAGAEITVT